MNSTIRIAVLIALAAYWSGCTAPPDPSAGKLDVRLDALFAHWNHQTPGGVLTIEKQGNIIYQKAFGRADLEHEVPVTLHTVFEAGSVAKQFTATAVLLLVLDGKLSLQEEVRHYLPELPDYGYKITLDHLLHHTSGIRDWGSIAAIGGWERGTRAYTNAHALDIIVRQQKLNFPPGDQYNYSNSNYNLLAIIVERVSGQSFAAFTQQRIFQPLGMKNTRWRTNFRSIVKNRAVAYNRVADRYYLEMPFENAHGNGGLLTTAADLLKWNRHYRTLRIGGKPLLERQLQPGKLNNGATIAYAGGVFIRQYQGVREISHGGLTGGYRAWLAYYPDEQLSVAFLSNDGSVNPEKIGGQVAEIVLGKRLITPIPPIVKLDQKTLQRYLGWYKCLRNDELFELELQPEGLHLKGYQTLMATSPYTFHWGASRMEFSPDLQRVLVFTGNGDSATFVRKNPTSLPPTMLSTYAGTYHSPEAETTMRIDLDNQQLRGFQRPDSYFALQPIYSDAFLNAKNRLFQFQRDSTGAITGFTLSSQRAQGLWFARLP